MSKKIRYQKKKKPTHKKKQESPACNPPDTSRQGELFIRIYESGAREYKKGWKCKKKIKKVGNYPN